MGFFSPGFVIGAASSLTNQIEGAKERNAEMMERRRNQFDELSREAKRELNRKKMTEQQYVDLAKEVLSPELKIQIGDDPALLAAVGKSFKTQSQVRGLTPSNFNKSLLFSGMTKEGKFDPAKAFNIVEPPKMDVETQTEEGFFGRAFRGITGAPSQQELAETDPSRLTTDIREASVNLNKIYNPLDFDDSAWNKAYKSFADSKNIQLGMTPTGQYSLENLQKADGEVRDKFIIINTLRQYQAYTEDDIGGITGHVEDIYKTARKSGDQFDTVVTQIAKDMNEVGVSEVLNNLDRYVRKADGGDTTVTSVSRSEPAEAGPAPSSTPGRGGVGRGTGTQEQDLESNVRAALSSLIESDRAVNLEPDPNKPPVYEVEVDGVKYRVQNDAGKLTILG
jgi:hypothetical protein